MTLVATRHPAVDVHVMSDRTFRPASNVVSTRHEDATVLVDTRRGLYYTLNELGWRIWEQIGTGDSVSTIIRTLRQEYALPSETIEADVLTFVDHLLNASLINRVEA